MNRFRLVILLVFTLSRLARIRPRGRRLEGEGRHRPGRARLEEDPQQQDRGKIGEGVQETATKAGRTWRDGERSSSRGAVRSSASRILSTP
jgi:hypothetical protein